jgi:hypothetical protein
MDRRERVWETVTDARVAGPCKRWSCPACAAARRHGWKERLHTALGRLHRAGAPVYAAEMDPREAKGFSRARPRGKDYVTVTRAAGGRKTTLVLCSLPFVAGGRRAEGVSAREAWARAESAIDAVCPTPLDGRAGRHFRPVTCTRGWRPEAPEPEAPPGQGEPQTWLRVRKKGPCYTSREECERRARRRGGRLEPWQGRTSFDEADDVILPSNGEERLEDLNDVMGRRPCWREGDPGGARGDPSPPADGEDHEPRIGD